MRWILIALLLFIVSPCYAEQTKPYNYYIGSWVWVTDDDGVGTHWGYPTGTVGLVDLRNIPQMSKKATAEGYGFFAVDGTLPAPYVLVGSGYLSSIPATSSIKNTMRQVCGYRPSGATLLDLIWDMFTNGSDPTGQNCVKPLMPTIQGFLELHLGGHSIVKRERFKYGVHPHTAKVKVLLQNDYREIRKQTKDKSNIYLKTLDYWGKKYRIINPENEFIPTDLPIELPILHETTITDDWNCSDADALDCDLAWTEYDEADCDLDIVSNQVDSFDASSSATKQCDARADSDLSGTDMYAQVSVTAYAATGSTNSAYWAGGGSAIRFDSSAETYYTGIYYDDAADTYRIYKVVTDTWTQLAESDTVTLTTPFTLYLEADGSSLDLKVGGSSQLTNSDSSITTGTRGGIAYYRGKWAGTDSADDFEAGDLGVPPATRRIFVVT